MHHPTDRIAHTTAFVTTVVEHWLEREIAQWVNPMKNRSDDQSHHERTLLPRSYISLPRRNDVLAYRPRKREKRRLLQKHTHRCMRMYIHKKTTHMHTYIHTYIHAYKQVHKYTRTCMHTYVLRTYIIRERERERERETEREREMDIHHVSWHKHKHV